MDPTTASFVDWPAPFNHLCIGNTSASLFNADGLAGYVEFNNETREKLITCELDALNQIYRELNLYAEPFELVMPLLIDICHDRYLYLMHSNTVDNGEEDATNTVNTHLAPKPRNIRVNVCTCIRDTDDDPLIYKTKHKRKENPNVV